MTKSTIIELMKGACQYLQDQLKDGMLPNKTLVSISISEDEVIATGVSHFPDDKQRCEFRVIRDEDGWRDATDAFNEMYQNQGRLQGRLYETDAEKPADGGGQET